MNEPKVVHLDKAIDIINHKNCEICDEPLTSKGKQLGHDYCHKCNIKYLFTTNKNYGLENIRT